MDDFLTLDRPRVFDLGMDTWREKPPQCPFNPSTSIQLSSWRVEVEQIICIFRLLGRLGTHVIRGGNDRPHPSRFAVKWCTFLGSISRRLVSWDT